MPIKNLAERQQTAVEVDPENTEWTDTAAENTAALTAKQRYERKRIQRHYDLHTADIDDAIAQIAAQHHTSKSQVASWLLAYALTRYLDDANGLWETLVDGKKPAQTLQYEWALTLPRRWTDILKQFIHAGTIDGHTG